MTHPYLNFIAYHGTAPGSPLIGGQDCVSSKTLDVLWVSTEYFLAAQFQDGEIRKLHITLENPIIIDDTKRQNTWPDKSHAYIAKDIQSTSSQYDAVVFPDTVDGMEVGNVIAIFPRQTPNGPSVEHAVNTFALRYYDDIIDDWVNTLNF